MVMMTVYMPRDFDDEMWRNSPSAWADDLKERGKVEPDGTAEFFVADILVLTDAVIAREGGELPAVPPGTNFVVSLLDGEACDQGDSLEEVVANMRESMKGWDWPMEVTFVFWHHHAVAQKIMVQ
ncbi:hypothetical protein [uncultured Hyphomicrobium sp.]|uniref:hypothetical protein n=1 Tax=uncultured Hyphomicrobium sp. TaxID=194373 RepID=UPI0025F69AAD|nr:hypothetical protein [uncultured Hyphomicrobium sp.]